MSNLFISAYGRSNVGKKRGNNEDNFYISGVTVDSALDITAKVKSTDETAFAVFDGMGGEAAGERASQATAVTYGQKMSLMLDGDFAPNTVQATIEAANKKVCDETRLLGKRMGCTFVSVGFKNDTVYVSNVGDSRAYLLRNGQLHCISKDHTVAQSMVDNGVISYEESQRIKEKHKLTQHIGIFPDELILEPYYSNISAQTGDIVLLCSDGLTDMLTDEDIANILRAGGTEEQITNVLVETALANGGKDNVTVIVGKVDGNVAAVPVVASVAVPVEAPATMSAEAPTVAGADGSVDVSSKSNSKFKLFAIIGGAVALVLVAVIVVLLLGGKGDTDDDKSKKEKTTKENNQAPIINVIPGYGDESTDSNLSTTDVDEQNTTAPSSNNPTQGGQENGVPVTQKPTQGGNNNGVPVTQKPTQDGNNGGSYQPVTQAPKPIETTEPETYTETTTEPEFEDIEIGNPSLDIDYGELGGDIGDFTLPDIDTEPETAPR